MVVNYTVLGLGSAAFVVMLLFRRWLWMIAVPPGVAILAYALLNTIHHRH
jgi:hypothetical protein